MKRGWDRSKLSSTPECGMKWHGRSTWAGGGRVRHRLRNPCFGVGGQEGSADPLSHRRSPDPLCPTYPPQALFTHHFARAPADFLGMMASMAPLSSSQG